MGDKAWDSDMHYGCLCDQGYRGPSCALVECPSANDPLDDKCTKTTTITNYQLQYDAPFGATGWEQAYSLKKGKAKEQDELANSGYIAITFWTPMAARCTVATVICL